MRSCVSQATLVYVPIESTSYANRNMNIATKACAAECLHTSPYNNPLLDIAYISCIEYVLHTLFSASDK